MTKINFREDGQGYFDFEYLLSLTNEEFVNQVLDSIIYNKNEMRLETKIEIKEQGYQIYVLSVTHSFCEIRIFDKSTKSITNLILPIFDIENIVSMFKELGVSL